MSSEPSAAEFVRSSILAAMQQEDASRSPRLPPATPGQVLRAKPSRYNLQIPITGERYLVHNTYTGAFSLWDTNDMALYQQVEQGEMSIHAKELRDLAYGGYIVAENEDERARLQQRYDAARFDSFSQTVTVAPTLDCNFGCDYCFQGLDKPHGLMSEAVQDRFIQEIAERAERGMKRLHIAWYGGEPLMGRSVIYRLSERVMAICADAKVNYSAFIVTNGFQLTRDVATRLREYKVSSCQVTLDGPASYHDQRRNLLNGKPTYQRIVENLREIVDHVPMMINIRVNIDERNVTQIKGLIDDLAERGFGGRSNFGLYFAPVEAITKPCQGCNNVTMAKQTYGQLEVELYRYAFEHGLTGLPKPPVFHGMCQAIRPNDFLLTPNGDVHKCWDTVHSKEMAVGTIFEPQRWSENATFAPWVQWSPFANDTCSNCKILPNCAGACAFKFIHRDQTAGEAGSLPCPSWKFNIRERLLFRAEKLGVISAADLLDQTSTDASLVGQRHTFESMSASGAQSVAAPALASSLPRLPVEVRIR